MSAKGSEPITSIASSTSRTVPSESSGPKISSRLTSESSGSPTARDGATNQPSSGTSPALAAHGLAGEVAVALHALLSLSVDHRRNLAGELAGLAHLEHLDCA